MKVILKRVLLIILYMLSCIVLFVTHMLLNVWQNLTMDELIFHILMPLEGTGKEAVATYVMQYGVPCLVVMCMGVYAVVSTANKNNHDKAVKIVMLFTAVAFLLSFIGINDRLDVVAYVENYFDNSDFIGDNYRNPDDCQVIFPEQKRNLIYIYVESMEMTFSNKKHGGAFKKNIIPNLTTIASENEDFSGADDTLNGGYALPGATWTMGAMFAESTGLPLSVDIGGNNLDTQENFYPDVVAIGDILERNGYNNVLMLGSDAVFGGRKTFFEQHGDYDIIDYNYAVENGLIPEDYYEFWGFEDEKLFEFAKDELTKLGSSSEPFNLTLLTVDTHFEDGYVCRLCDSKFGDNQYANVMACADRQLGSFINWIKEQDFYEDTTIVISGDHPTMDSDFCSGVSEKYNRRVYTAFINSVKEAGGVKREYSTFDFYPTTLAALGAYIPGNTLGLGVDLYSDEPTLLERYGKEVCETELAKPSDFLGRMNRSDLTEALLARIRVENVLSLDLGDDNNINIMYSPVHGGMIFDNINGYKSLEAKIICDGREYYKTLNYNNVSGNYTGRVKCDHAEKYFDMEISLILDDDEKVLLTNQHDLLLSTEFSSFLRDINNPDYTVFISAKDDCTTALDKEHMELLFDLGITTKLDKKYRQSYYAVISRGEVLEKAGPEHLKTTGSIRELDLDYSVESAGFTAGDFSSIIVNGREYSLNMRGLNFVIYDNNKKDVVVSCNFDTYETLEFTDMDIRQ